MFKTAELYSPDLGIAGALRRNRLLLSLVAINILCGIAVSVHLGTSFWGKTTPLVLHISEKLSYFMIASFFMWRLGVAMLVVKPEKPIHWMLKDVRDILTDKVRVPDAVISYFCIIAMAVTYSFLKNEIHTLNPNLWDNAFAQWDRAIHGGKDAWQLLWPVLGFPLVTSAINAAYHGWFLLNYAAVCLACLDRSDPTRSTVFLVAFVLCWFVGGNVIATYLSSVGPVYFEPFGFGDTYLPQMDLLRETHLTSPVWALEVQQGLLDAYFTENGFRGISAMPSMHVASSVVIAIYGFTYYRWLGWALTAFAGVILLGSVHLAWHYAIDGYVSIVLALIFWWVAKKLTARFGPGT